MSLKGKVIWRLRKKFKIALLYYVKATFIDLDESTLVRYYITAHSFRKSHNKTVQITHLLLGLSLKLKSLGRDSPIVKHDPQIRNPCFVTCVNSPLFS
jgi:hypothetical protein